MNITAKFRNTEHLPSEDTRENCRPKIFGTFENRAPESKTIASWILNSDPSVRKGKRASLRWITWYKTYCRTEKIWIKLFPITSSFGTSIKSKPIQIKYCLERLFRVSSSCFSLSPNLNKHAQWYLDMHFGHHCHCACSKSTFTKHSLSSPQSPRSFWSAPRQRHPSSLLTKGIAAFQERERNTTL